MCNPPFYGSREEVAQSAEAKELGPNAVRIEFSRDTLYLTETTRFRFALGQTSR